MIDKVLPFLKKSLPIGAAMKGIASADPRLKAFVYAASAAGYGSDMIMNFLREVGGKDSKKELKERVARRKAQGTARPDELARAEQFESGEKAQKVLSAGIGLASGLGAAAGAGRAIQSLPKLAGGLGAAAIAGRGTQDAPAMPRVEVPALEEQEAPPAVPEVQAPPAVPVPGAPQAQAAAVPAELASQAPAVEAQAIQRSYFERAMEGVSFFDLSEDIKPKVGILKKKIDNLEAQGAPYEDKSVQKVARALRKMGKRSGLVEQEAQRFQSGYGEPIQAISPIQSGQPAQPAQSTADEQLARILQEFSKKLNM